MGKSILVQDMEYCLFCGSPFAEEHPIFFGTANRTASDKNHLVLPLCHEHHRTGKDSPHRNRIVDLALKYWAQTVYEEKCGSRADFRQEFGKSYM